MRRQALAALFAFGGRLADTAGHRRMVVLGVIIFAGASALCGLTPSGTIAEAWLVAFRAVQGAGASPLMNVHIFANRQSLVDIILGIAMMAFIPVFFFASIYGQIALAENATTASLLLLYFFLGFVVCAQIGGRMLARVGARRLPNYGASLGFAILSTVLVSQFRSAVTDSLVGQGLPHAAASAQASKIAQLQGSSGNVADIPLFIRTDFADATRAVLYAMAVIMGVAAVVALRGLGRGVQEETEAVTAEAVDQRPDVPSRRRRPGRRGRAAGAQSLVSCQLLLFPVTNSFSP